MIEEKKSIIFIIMSFKIMISLLMVNVSLYTQALLPCSYSSLRFVYQYYVFGVVASISCQETDFIVF